MHDWEIPTKGASTAWPPTVIIPGDFGLRGEPPPVPVVVLPLLTHELVDAVEERRPSSILSPAPSSCPLAAAARTIHRPLIIMHD